MMRFEYDPKFVKLLAKEMVKEMQKIKSAYSGDSRSPIPMISVHSVGDLLYRRQN